MKFETLAQQKAWKILTLLLLCYTIIAGLLTDVPRLPILNESIRNLYFHVTMWMAMMVLFIVSVTNAVLYLYKPSPLKDIISSQTAKVGIFIGLIGIATGSIWARFTWGAFWVNDPKLNGSAIGILIYLAYLLLRNSLTDRVQRARISAVYNIFAFATLIPLIYILPRLTDSLHPGNGGNVAFSKYDLDSGMRLVFYPACFAWSLLGLWIASLRIRIQILNDKLSDKKINF